MHFAYSVCGGDSVSRVQPQGGSPNHPPSMALTRTWGNSLFSPISEERAIVVALSIRSQNAQLKRVSVIRSVSGTWGQRVRLAEAAEELTLETSLVWVRFAHPSTRSLIHSLIDRLIDWFIHSLAFSIKIWEYTMLLLFLKLQMTQSLL